MKRIYLVLYLTGVSLLLSAQSGDSLKYQSMDPYDFHLAYLRADTAMMIDVREPFEFRGKKIHDAINIPSSGNLEYASDTISKKYTLFFYCTTGYRSSRVADYFYDRGFRDLYNLEGGIVAWKNDGFPLTRRNRKK